MARVHQPRTGYDAAVLGPMKRKDAPTKTFKGNPKRAKVGSDHQEIIKLKRQVNVLKKANETHTFDVTANVGLTSAAISGTYPSCVRCLNCPLLGDFYNNRQGNQVLSRGFKLKGAIYSQAAEINQQTFRVIVYCDTQNNGILSPSVIGAPTSNSFLDNAGVLVENLMPNWQNRKRFIKLYDKTLICNPSSVSDYDPITGNTSTVVSKALRFDTFIPFTKIINYNQNNAALASDIQQNAVYIAIFSDAPTNLSVLQANASFLTRWFFCEA